MTGRGRQLRILAFEPFDAGSHRAVRCSIERHSRHRWQWVTRPGRAWKWRMRLAAIEMIEQINEAVDALGTPDLLLATSLMSVADLRSLLPPSLRGCPVVLLMHENQASYPANADIEEVDRERDLHFALTNLTSVLAADRILWNSEWNRDSFLEGIARIIGRAPDCMIDWRATCTGIRERSVIAPLPVEVDPALYSVERKRAPGASHSVRVVWPHRWEHDKGPEALLDLARRYTALYNLRWTILGERARRVPPSLETFFETFADRIDHVGFIERRDAYLDCLASCDWVLSTARHEFFGIAVVEALLCGCLPWLPDRLSYPALLPRAARGVSPANPPVDAHTLRSAIRTHLDRYRAPHAVAAIDDILACY